MSLERVDAGIWVVDGPIVSFYGFPYPTRSVIVRLPAGGLWVWSPIALTEELREEVDALGPVAHLVSPNKLHHLALAEWQAAYPTAALWGPASLLRKRADLHFTAALGDTGPKAWSGVIDPFLIHASPLLEEVVFLHKPSSTVIIGDLSEAFSEDFLRRYWPRWQQWIARIWGITENAGKAPLELRVTAWHRRAARKKLQRLLNGHPQHIIMAHGVWQRTNGQAYLARAFDWLDLRSGGAAHQPQR